MDCPMCQTSLDDQLHCQQCKREWKEVEYGGEKVLISKPRKVHLAKDLEVGAKLDECLVPYRKYGNLMSYKEAKEWAHVRSAIRRASKPDVKYWKNHPTPFDERVPLEDQEANDWQEYDPREEEGCSAFNEMPA